MSELTLSGATVADTGQKVRDGQSDYHAKLACAWSDEFCALFSVQTPSEPYGKSPISRVNLAAVNFILTPAKPEMASFEINVDCGAVNKFQYVPRFDKAGKVQSRELHFHVALNSLSEFVKVATYADSVGEHPADIKIVYNENTQTELDLNGDEHDQDDSMDLDESDESADAAEDSVEAGPEDGPVAGPRKRGRKAKA